MLPKKHRLLIDEDFQAVFKKGRSFFSPIINIRYFKNKSELFRFGIVVSNKVSKKATIRNNIKRRLRAVIRKHFDEIKPSFDCVVIAKPAILNSSYKEIEETVLKLLKRAQLL